jgi:hypothetical protein
MTPLYAGQVHASTRGQFYKGFEAFGVDIRVKRKGQSDIIRITY